MEIGHVDLLLRVIGISVKQQIVRAFFCCENLSEYEESFSLIFFIKGDLGPNCTLSNLPAYFPNASFCGYRPIPDLDYYVMKSVPSMLLSKKK